MKQRLGTVVVAILAALVTGCGTLELDVYPLFRTGPVDGEGSREWEALGPLLYGRTERLEGGKPRGEWGVRPLFSHATTEAGRFTTTEVLWPLGRFHRTPSSWSDWMVPIYWHWGNSEASRAGSSLMVFPFLFRRVGRPGDSLAVFPFYGDMKKVFGMDELTFVLFPFYARTRGSMGRSHHLLWPFFGWGGNTGDNSGDYRNAGEDAWWFRVFPLIARSVRVGHHDTHTYLWPLVSLTEDLLYTARPRSGFMVWPLYGALSRDQASGWAALYPLFSRYEDTLRGEGTVNLPFPFYSAWWDPHGEGWRLWPLHGRSTSGPTRAGSYLRSSYYLWPLVWDREFGRSGSRHQAFHVAPVWLSHTWTNAQGAGSRLMVFPLLDVVDREDHTGKVALGCLFPLPVVNDAVHEHWGVFFSPYIRWSRPGGRLREQSILGLYRRFEAPGFSRWTVPLVYSSRRSRAGSLHQFLMGAVRLETEASGGTQLRILGIPVPLAAPAPDKPAPDKGVRP